MQITLEQLADMHSDGPRYVTYWDAVSEDGTWMYLERDDWESLGRPSKITVEVVSAVVDVGAL